MKILIKESQYVYLLENLEKNKKFLTKVMGIDFTGKIEQITSSYDVPMEFDRHFAKGMINRYLNNYGPMYLFELDGYEYLYLDMGDHEKFIDEKGNIFIENEIPERLGIDVMGLRFSDIINMYFNEEETLNESTDKNKKFLTNHMGIDFTGKIEKVKSFYDIPYNFYKGFSTMSEVTSYLKRFGPMYFFELGDYEYLYQNRGNKDWFIDEYGHVYDKDEFLERLGLDVLGLRFSDVIKIYSNEEEEDMITENKQNNPIDRILKSHKITYDINYKKRSYFRGDQLDSVDITFYIDRGNGRKPEAMQTVYFKTRGNKIIPHTEPIIYGDFHWMFDVFEFIPTKLLTPYFTDKAKEYIEEYLPIEYRFG